MFALNRMEDWYVRGVGPSQQIISLDTESIPPILLRLSRLAAIAVAVAGVGILYWEHLTRLRRAARQEVKSRRLVRKLLDRKRRGHTPLYDVSRQSYQDLVPDTRTNTCFNCLYGRCALRNHCPIPSIPPNVLTRNQLVPTTSSSAYKKPLLLSSSYRKSSSSKSYLPSGKLFLSPERTGCDYPLTSICPDFPRGTPDGQDSSCQGENWEEEKWKEDVEEKEMEEGKAKSMKDVIRTAKEVRRLIRGNSAVSSSCDLVSMTEDREFELEGEYNEADFSEEFFRKGDRDFRHHLQLTTIDDSWSDTRSVTRRSVLSTSPELGRIDFDNWDWEEDMVCPWGERDWEEEEEEHTEDEELKEEDETSQEKEHMEEEDCSSKMLEL